MTDGHRQPNNHRPRPGSAAAEHLSDERLNELLDGALAAAAEPATRAHLASCAHCAERFDELKGVRLLLRGLPAPLPRRSFQLTPEQARIRGAIWDRLGIRLMPAMAALRAATIAIALLLAAAVAGELLTEPEPAGFVAEEAAPLTTPREAMPAGTRMEEAGDAAGIEAAEDETARQADTGLEQPVEGVSGAAPAGVADPGAAGGAAQRGPAGAEDQPAARAADDAGAGYEPAADAALAESAPVEAPAAQAESADAPFAAITAEEPETGATDAPAAMAEPAAAGDETMTKAEASPTPIAAPATPSPEPTAVASPSPVAPDAEETAGARTAPESAWWRIVQVALGALLIVCLAGLLLVRRAGLARA